MTTPQTPERTWRGLPVGFSIKLGGNVHCPNCHCAWFTTTKTSEPMTRQCRNPDCRYEWTAGEEPQLVEQPRGEPVAVVAPIAPVERMLAAFVPTGISLEEVRAIDLPPNAAVDHMTTVGGVHLMPGDRVRQSIMDLGDRGIHIVYVQRTDFSDAVLPGGSR